MIYLPKPFNPRELLARLRAVLRRTSERGVRAAEVARGYRFAGWRLEAGAGGGCWTRMGRRCR